MQCGASARGNDQAHQRPDGPLGRGLLRNPALRGLHHEVEGIIAEDPVEPVDDRCDRGRKRAEGVGVWCKGTIRALLERETRPRREHHGGIPHQFELLRIKVEAEDLAGPVGESERIPDVLAHHGEIYPKRGERTTGAVLSGPLTSCSSRTGPPIRTSPRGCAAPTPGRSSRGSRRAGSPAARWRRSL